MSRDPDLFLALLERQADKEDFLLKNSGDQSDQAREAHQERTSNIGIMATCTLGRDTKELASTKGKNFAFLVHAYRYRKDLVTASEMKSKKRQKSVAEVLCRLNHKTCKKAGLKEISATWKSLTKLARELIDTKQRFMTALDRQLQK